MLRGRRGYQTMSDFLIQTMSDSLLIGFIHILCCEGGGVRVVVLIVADSSLAAGQSVAFCAFNSTHNARRRPLNPPSHDMPASHFGHAGPSPPSMMRAFLPASQPVQKFW